MKSILEWLNEAKQQGYDWADAAIRNYNPNFTTIKKAGSLREALVGAFSWKYSPEKEAFWDRVRERLRSDEEMGGFPLPITPVTPIPLESLIEDLGKLNKALENLEYNDTLKEPYRTQVYEATKASYEEQLAETKAKIAGVLGIEPINERKLIGWVVQNKDGEYSKYTAPVVAKDNRGWAIASWGGWSGITTEEAVALCGRVPQLSDNEPTPVYQ